MKHPTEVDQNAPVIANLHIDIDAPRDTVWRLHTDVNAWPSWQTDITEARLDQPLAEGASFDWSTYGMAITSTVYALDEGSRILWGGEGNGITGIHEWTFTDVPTGVWVTTTESFAGGPFEADTATMQGLLDQSLQSWLERLKAMAEQR
jgi:uncharacterized protein YndB with AHSA1/START domain